MSKILLINPPYHRLKGMKDIFFPLGIGYLGSFLREKNPQRTIKLYNSENPSHEEVSNFVNLESIIDKQMLFESNYENDDYVIWNELRDVIRDYRPDIVGITVMSCKYRPALKITNIIKEISPETITVWGGPHCSATGPSCLERNECIDYVISNEGEIAFPK